MWIFTDEGFFSVVSDRDNPGRLLVRARVREDLVRLRKKDLGMRSWPPIVETPNADYPYRMWVQRDHFADVLHAMVVRIRYPNFKGQVRQVLGSAYSAILERVWALLVDFEEQLRERSGGEEKAGAGVRVRPRRGERRGRARLRGVRDSR